MRAIIQRVSRAQVVVNQEIVAQIGSGLVTLLGVEAADQTTQADKLIDKIINLRVFADEQGKMNRSLFDRGGDHLIVSQFTLFADCRKGRRPAFTQAAPPEHALTLYEYARERSRKLGVPTQGGVFQAHMQLELVNDGPVTLFLDTFTL